MISAQQAISIVQEKEKEHQEHLLAKRERLLEDIERRIKEASAKREREIKHRVPKEHVIEFENLLKGNGFNVTKSYVRDSKNCDLTITW
jgi:cysteine sulfinate desulfinase/cysteine desulfurase-like protein